MFRRFHIFSCINVVNSHDTERRIVKDDHALLFDMKSKYCL